MSGGSRLYGVVSPRALTAITTGVLVACIAVAAVTAERAHWRPLGLLALLAGFTIVAELGTIQFAGHVQAALTSLGLALAITFLGAAPALAIGIPPVTIDALQRRLPAPIGSTGRRSRVQSVRAS